ncbi:MAG: hypothetical protein M9936_27535 [Caldilinea sp.]|nr:hypothetical protein [Caldilinea sp.]MCB0058693.1 hypothetical protein [Caldilineaceae bacterium]MCB0038692.1 hypothetical protein [Caldilinea sp.]MCB0067654.1 hypothetical protein [Caldilineaceae bacterium]MCB0135177.1 hypothetical protein [Caldilineaceae bacterium]
MLNYNDQMVAQQRYEDMRREAARDAQANAMQGNARSAGPMQRLISAVAKLRRREVRTGAQVQQDGRMVEPAA